MKMEIFLLFFMFIFPEIYCKGPNIRPNPFFKLPFDNRCILLCLPKNSPRFWPRLVHGYKETTICQIGCLLFDSQIGGGLDVNPAIKHCQDGCRARFRSKYETKICGRGCEHIASEYQSAVQKELIMTPQERWNVPKNILQEPEPDVEDTIDLLLSDPSIRSQLEVGFNVDYKIPETNIRTMPIEDKVQPIDEIKTKPKDNGDWLDCASKNSGVPKWILLSTIMGAIILALWLTLAMESRKGREGYDEELVEKPDLEDKEDEVGDKDAALLGSVDCDVQSETVDVQFAPPPKYSEVTEQDNSEPPNYSEVVGHQNREEIA